MNSNFTESEYGYNYKDHILEQYKIYIEMSDRISQRRLTTNTFFISANTFLITMVTIFSDFDFTVFRLTAIMGIILSFAWYFLLNSYRQMNSSKFKVIHEMEDLLPLSIYKEEWNKLEHGKNKKLYWPVSHLEKMFPVLMGIFYIILFVYTFGISL